MTKKKDPQDLLKEGAKTKYKISYNREVYELILLGATMKKIADFFNVHIDTLYEWMKVYPKFSESVAKGRVADMKVAASMYKQANGYYYMDGDGKKKFMPPTYKAGALILKNRHNEDWGDKQEVEIHQYDMLEILKNMPEEEREERKKELMKRLNKNKKKETEEDEEDWDD